MGSNHMNHQFGSGVARLHNMYKESPILFMKDNWLGMKGGMLKHLEPRDYQIDFIESIHKNKVTFSPGSRQMGATSMMACYIAWLILFHDNKRVMAIGHNTSGSVEILNKVKRIIQGYSALGVFNYEENIVHNNKTELKLKNGSWIKVRGAAIDAGKGEELDLLYIDQAAYIKNMENIWMAVAMCIVRKGKAVVTSTPRDNSFFNKMCLESDANIFKLDWKKNKELDEEWYEDECRKLGYDESLIEQEIDCVINYKDKTSKDKTISLRIDLDTYNKMKLKAGDLKISDYIRYLIDHDLS